MVTNMGMTEHGKSVMEEIQPLHTTNMNEPVIAPSAPAATRRRMFGTAPGFVALGLFAVAGAVAWYGGAADALARRFVPSILAEEKTEPAILNVNSATADELCLLPSVDEKIAAAIIAKRPFTTVEDILDVKGIGEKKLAKIRPLIKVE